MKTEHTIWQNYSLDYEDWKEDLEDLYGEMKESQGYETMCELNREYLEDERVNLNKTLDRNILVIADLGLWDGRHSAYKEIGNNIKDCLYDSDANYARWFVDKQGDFRAECSHHDGTNKYLYRTYKTTASDAQIENLKRKIYKGTVQRKDITRVTDSVGKIVACVYGWK